MQALSWRWPIAIVVVVIGIAAIQFVRVNPPKESAPAEPPRTYTPVGSIVKDQVTIPSRNFFSNQIDLNRRSKLIGSFKTANVRSRVSVIVMDEKNFESWKSGSAHQALAQTGQVPGGKINVALEPGVFFLVVENLQGEADQQVYLDFSLER